MKLDYGTMLQDRALWMQGGTDDERNCFTSGGTTALRLITPLLLPAMTKIIFTVPEGVRVRAVLCERRTDGNTGNVNADFSFDLAKTKWRTKNYELYAGNKETYVLFVVSYEDGRAFTAEDMPVRFYIPQANVLPAYWVPALEDARARIEQSRREFPNAAELFYLTDVHWTDNAQHSPTILNHLSRELNIPYVVFGGDMIVRYNPDRDCAKREVTGFFGQLDKELFVFSTLGNHDRNYSSGNTNRALRFSESESHELYMSGIERFAVTEGDPSHGYFDLPEQKLRMVQFYLSDSMFGMPEDSYVDGALDWVEQKILELDRDWTVILFTHAYSRGMSADGDLVITEKNRQISNRLLSIKENARAELAFWITGHIHVDMLDQVTNGRTTLPLLSVLSDGYKYASSPLAARMRVGTATEQAIDCIRIDPTSRTLHFIRIGAGEDRSYRY